MFLQFYIGISYDYILNRMLLFNKLLTFLYLIYPLVKNKFSSSIAKSYFLAGL